MSADIVGIVGSGNVTNGAGPVSVPLPQQATAGNALLVALTGSSGSGVTVAPTPPTGWDLIAEDDIVSGTSRGWMWLFGKKVADGSEASVSFPWSGGNMYSGWCAVELSGADVTAWPTVYKDQSASPTGTLHPAGDTSTADDALGIAFLGGRSVALGLYAHSIAGLTDLGGPTGGVANCYVAATDVGIHPVAWSPSITFNNQQGNPATIAMSLLFEPVGGGGGGGGGQTDNTAYTEQLDFGRDDSGSPTVIGTSATIIGGGVGISCAPTGPNHSLKVVCGGRVQITAAGAGSIELQIIDTTGGGSGTVVARNRISGSFLAGVASKYVDIPDRSFDLGLNQPSRQFAMKVQRNLDSGSSLAASLLSSANGQDSAWLKASAE